MQLDNKSADFEKYRQMFEILFSDGYISGKNRAELIKLQIELGLSDTDIEKIEKTSSIEEYSQLFEVFYEDFKISEAERELLNKKKSELDLSEIIISGIENYIIKSKAITNEPNKAFQYFGFISYSRRDEKYAKWLQRKIESYKLPSIIRKVSEKPLPKKVRPIFRDKTDISVGGLLNQSLYGELKASKYLIVICSPNAAESNYVSTEIEDFIRINGNEDRIIPFIVNGSPEANNCYPKALKTSLLGVSVREIGKPKAFLKVVARILELNFDELYQRHKKRQKKIVLRNLSITFIVLLSLIQFFIWSFRLNDLNQLVSVGKEQQNDQNTVTASLLFREAILNKSCSDKQKQEILGYLEQCYYRDPTKAFGRFYNGSPIKNIAIDPTEQLIGLGTEDGTVTVWNLQNTEKLKTIKHPQPINALCFSYKDNFLYTLMQDKTITVWDLVSLEEISEFDLKESIGKGIVINMEIDSTDQFISVGYYLPQFNAKQEQIHSNIKVVICDLKLKTILFNSKNIYCSNFNSDATYTQCDSSGNIIISDLKNNKNLTTSITLSTNTGSPCFISKVNSNSIYLLTDKWHNFYLNISSRKIENEFILPNVEWTLNNSSLLSRNGDNYGLGLTDMKSGKKLKTLNLYSNAYLKPILASNKGDTLIGLFNGGTTGISFIDIKNNRIIYDIYPNHTGAITNFALSNNYFAIASEDGYASIYPRYYNNLKTLYKWDEKNKNNILMDATEKYGISYNRTEQAMIYCDISNGDSLLRYKPISNLLNAKLDTLNQKIFLLSNEFGKINLIEYSILEKRVLRSFKMEAILISSSFSSKAKYLALYYKKDLSRHDADNEHFKIINLETFIEEKEFGTTTKFINISISDDAKTIMAFNEQKELYKCDVDSLDLIDFESKINTQNRFLTHFNISNDNRYFVVSLSDDIYSSNKIVMADALQEYNLHTYYSYPSQFLFTKLLNEGECILAQNSFGEILIWRNLMTTEEIINGMKEQLGDREITDFDKETYEIGLEYYLKEVNY